MVRFVPVVLLLFALSQAAYATADLAPPEGDAVEASAIVPEKANKVASILSNPPPDIPQLMKAVSFHIYGKDKHGNYIAFCRTKNIDWDIVKENEKVSQYMKYMALFFWIHVDRRQKSTLSVVVDAEDLPASKVLNGSVTILLSSIIRGLNSTWPYVGQRSGRVIIVNSPGFLRPGIGFASKLLPESVYLVAYSDRSQWEPLLKEFFGAENLPVEYGGTNPVEVKDSIVVKHIEGSVLSIMKQKAGLRGKL